MNRTICALTLLITAGAADAALVSRAGGQAYYDDVRNLTWLADTDLAKTSGYDADGVMTWFDALVFVGSLNSANHLGASDWRLPVTPQPDASCSNQSPGVSSDFGCTGSELGFLFNVNGVTAAHPGPFANLRAATYWSGTTYAPDAGKAWVLDFYNGLQYASLKLNIGPVWVVRTGDISAVPAPATVWLLGTGLAALGAWRQRRMRANRP